MSHAALPHTISNTAKEVADNKYLSKPSSFALTDK